MVSEDRRLRLAGYEVYRFGGAELFNGTSRSMVEEFLQQLTARMSSQAYRRAEALRDHRHRVSTVDWFATASSTAHLTSSRTGKTPSKPLAGQRERHCHVVERGQLGE
ncbi:hypothetical protein [Rhodococcus qingshengii]|uniref:hypothetical protein n=1 Tax=Rhodococcus qingshengii TaxID=334542 RepID=UPI0035F8F269